VVDPVSSRTIDSLRVIACGVVVASHAYEMLTGVLDNPINETISYTAVAVFFFLSGYVNQLSYQEKPGYPAFLAARARRLLPLYYLVALFSLALAWGAGLLRSTDWLNLLFLQSIAVPTVATNGPLWSLAWEMVLYLAFPLVLGIVRRPVVYLVPLVVLLVLFGRHQVLLLAFLGGVTASYYGWRFPRFVFLPGWGRWTYEVYACHYPLMFLAYGALLVAV